MKLFNFIKIALYSYLLLSFLQISAVELPLGIQAAPVVEERFSHEPQLAEMSEEEREFELAINALDWKGPGLYSFPDTNATLTLPENYLLLFTKDANKFITLIDELEEPYLQALVISHDFQSAVYLSNHKEGYVSIEEWEDLQPAELLKNMQKNTEETNIERKKLGQSPIYVKGWLQEPTLNKETNTVFWATEVVGDDGKSSANATAFKLGREGYEELVWVVKKEAFIPFGGDLEVMLDAFSFEPGFRYNDYTYGDKVAEYGIAALVAATAGGKLLKASGLLFFLKKYLLALLAAVGGIFYKIKDYFNKRPTAKAEQ